MPSASEDPHYFRQLCEHLGVAVIATDRDFLIRVWNAAAGRLFGAAAERMIGTPVLTVLPAERRESVERLLARVLQSGEPSDFDFEQRDARGFRRQLTAILAPVVLETGERSGVSLCIRDITVRIALQNELNESRKLTALGELAGAVAHHFNNILGGAITAIDYVRTGSHAGTTDRLLDQVGRSLLRATTLVNGLLAFAQADRRTEDLADFTEIVSDIADDMEAICADRKVRFEFRCGTLPVFPVPAVQVRTILRNILQNGLEAMPDGGVLTLDVRLDEDHVVATISDTGVGMDEAALARLFEPFWTTKGGLGTDRGPVKGLGLAIAHGLTRILGGTIEVTSEVNKGSCFVVSFPSP